jgi:predicted Zn-ribbon and HTH transcriptional regulator
MTKGAYNMRKKVVITLIVLGILLFGVIVLHVLSAFSSFTLGLKEEQYKVLVSDAILVLAVVFVLAPLFQVSEKTKKLRQVSKNMRKLQREVADVVIGGAYVLIQGHRCYRCGYEWRPKNMDVGSRICPICKSPYWDRPRRKR